MTYVWSILSARRILQFDDTIQMDYKGTRIQQLLLSQLTFVCVRSNHTMNVDSNDNNDKEHYMAYKEWWK